MTPRLNDMQLDALRELANIASGTAATALGQMLGQEVGLSVPVARWRFPWPTPSMPAGPPSRSSAAW